MPQNELPVVLIERARTEPVRDRFSALVAAFWLLPTSGRATVHRVGPRQHEAARQGLDHQASRQGPDRQTSRPWSEHRRSWRASSAPRQSWHLSPSGYYWQANSDAPKRPPHLPI